MTLESTFIAAGDAPMPAGIPGAEECGPSSRSKKADPGANLFVCFYVCAGRYKF